ncbi:Sugar kinase of the NBD/HSP70 family, may contain an N-terminal HTH domain [Prosthecobacter debontii]|uniref:Sugar kinase of the NBD/HSP70 family, may contain an N-terminal HTH domain n=1 Tax=Prosthecobacter debontii TaxID=48467 RepID=A0A1T4Y5W7_9BACT|nr:ROK family protein [Prosthecobacter debontii]SKA97043.1 Sugar kinase of the NBD/HSP70 family, may contain an N-terminal HTH domain [Prosthecobacter debontii]
MRQKNSDLRQLLASTVLQVRSGRATSRTTLARALGISASTMGIYVDQLIATGHLHESGLDHGLMGRPKRRLSIRSNPGWFAGVEFNADRLQLVGVDFAGLVIHAETLPLPENMDAADAKNHLMEVLARLCSRQSTPLLGLGVGAPGLVNTESGIALRYSFIKGWENIPLKSFLEEKLSVPVTVESNLRAIALAEKWFGSHRELSDYVVVGPRSGFGIACVQRGRLIQGAHYAAGEIGLWPWPLSGDTQATEMHRVLSAPMTYRRLAGIAETAPVPQDLYTAMLSIKSERHPQWDDVITDFARVLGCVQLLLDPRICFLHGPLTALGESFCSAIMEASRGIAPALKDIRLSLVCSQLGDDAGALGAASLAMEHWLPKYV